MNRIGWTKKKATIALTLCAIIAFSSFMFLQTNQTTQAALINPIHSGLVGWWSFDEGSGTVAGDGSGNGNTGTIFGATWVIGNFGQALSFDGTNYVNFGNTPSLSITGNAVTLEAWVYPSNLARYENIAAKFDYPNDNGYMLIHTNTGLLQFYVGNNGAQSVTSNVSLSSGVWQHVAAVYNGVDLRIYINGVLSCSPVAFSNNIGATTQAYYVGSANGYSKFTGLVDEVRVYNRAHSASEIQADFQNPDFATQFLAKVPQGTTQVITTLSWQGTASINVTIVSPSQTYTESMVPMYQKTTYSTSDGISSMLNIKRLSVSVNALPTDQNWNVTLTFDNPVPYQITVEVQK